MTDVEYLIRRLAMLLDASLPALDKVAAEERRREAGKALRSITAQERAKAAREAIADAEAFLEALE